LRARKYGKCAGQTIAMVELIFLFRNSFLIFATKGFAKTYLREMASGIAENGLRE
jgi:hypothetical protein